MNKYFITGIGTGVGKTIVSAILTEALQGDYWKPIQCGMDGGTDTERVAELISNSRSVLHKESYCFKAPVSPHWAAELEYEKIRPDKLILPETNSHLIIEGAGGLMVPLTDQTYAIDMAREFEAGVILVCKNYLGCINHSLLSIDYLLRNEFEVKGIILNGNFDKAVKAAICNYSEVPLLAEIPEIYEVTKETVLIHAQNINLNLFE
jgi:dethiobiotin synthetase